MQCRSVINDYGYDRGTANFTMKRTYKSPREREFMRRSEDAAVSVCTFHFCMFCLSVY
jgi:hypothetical protein